MMSIAAPTCALNKPWRVHTAASRTGSLVSSRLFMRGFPRRSLQASAMIAGSVGRPGPNMAALMRLKAAFRLANPGSVSALTSRTRAISNASKSA